MTSATALLALVTLSATAGLGRLEPTVRTDDGSGGDAPSAAWPTATVCETISALERRTPSLGKGVLVVAADWSTDGDVPPAFLRTMQARDGQPVYAADVARLLADGRRGDGAPPPGPCGRPAGRDRASLLLPPSARYVVLFRGRGGPPPDPFRGLAALNYTFWGGDVYYLIVARDFDRTVQRMVYGVWRDLSVYKIIVITRTAIKLLDPFARDVRFTNVPLRLAGLVPAALNTRIRNMRLSPLRFAINRRPPTVVATTTDGGGGGGSPAYVGQDGTFAALLAAKMNATPVYVSEPSDNGKIYYGYRRSGNGVAYGTFAGIVDGVADVSVNGHFLKDYNCHMAELTRHITSDKVCLLTPKAGVVPPVMTVLMSFQREVWMMTAFTCIMVTLIYYAATALDARRPNLTGCDLGLEIYRMFIGAPTNRVFAQSCQRILTSFCLVFTIVILNAFQGSLVTFLNTPMHYSDINTFTDLIESDLPIRTSSISFKEILTGDPNLKSLAYRVEKWAKEEDIYDSDGRFAGFQRVNVFNLGHFKDVLFVANRNNTRVLHTMNECLISYFISYVIHRDSPYKRRINMLLSWIDQAGLVLKWNSDVSKYIFDKYKPINPKDYESSKVFSVRDLEIAFIVLSFGIILSVIVFIVELLLTYKEPAATRAPPTALRHAPRLPFLH